ncbi:MAG TPA: cytochrome c biogenesis protein CcdC [Acidobacteriaceae bacterium]|nr:cytochrome c biogenesis protein CcdC [Acidobacteriaceae bacterium]
MISPKELSLLASLVGACGVLIWRVHEGRSVVTARKILIPPLGMATGFSMFIAPQCRIPWLWGLGAFLLGATVLAWPLLRTSRLTRVGDNVMMQRSNAFFLVVIVLAIVRVAAHSYFDQFLSITQTGAIFFVLAFGMILHWRARMYHQYLQITAPAGSSGPSVSEA